MYAKKLDDDTSIEVLSLYTKSIAFAPNNSEELALGFGNRSALLKQMQKFEECITDINRAMSIYQSDELKAKLSLRKASCLKLIKELKLDSKLTKKNSNKLELPKMIPSKKVPCVAESLSLKHSEKYGKHMIANQDIKPGEIIAIEEAYVAHPYTNKLYIICSHCLSKTLNGIPCNFCAATIYCSENCKNQAWSEYHDIECSVVHKIPFSTVPKWLDINHTSKFALKFFIKIIKNHSLEKIIQEVKESGKH